MPVAELVRFVDLCRSFGVDVSPAETAGFVGDFGAMEADDRELIEEAAVGALARDSESEAVVRRLFALFFAGRSPAAVAEDARQAQDARMEGERLGQDAQRDAPEPKEKQKTPRDAGPDRTRALRTASAPLSPDQVQAIAEALEALAGAGDESPVEPDPHRPDAAGSRPAPGLPDSLFEEAATALAALGPRGASRKDRNEAESAAPRDRRQVERLLREMARPREAERLDRTDGREERPEEPGEGDGQQGAEDGQEGEGQGQGAGAGSGEGGQGQGRDGQGDGTGQGGRGGTGTGRDGSEGQGGTGRGDGRAVQGAGRGSGRGSGLLPSTEAESAAQRLGSACATMVAEGLLAFSLVARLAAALLPGLSRTFIAQLTNALAKSSSAQRRERLEQALEAVAGRMMAEGAMNNREVARLLSAADERLKLQTFVSGAGLRSLLHDSEALADLLHRYRRRRDLLPVLVARLADALRRMLTRPSPVRVRSDHGRLDFRATMRDSLPYGGVPLDFQFRRKRQEHEIVLALDTSGSQRAWAASAVLAAHALGRLLPRLRAYSFTSDLHEVTRYLARPERFVERLEDFSGFSNYQTALGQLEMDGRLSRRTTLIVVGDCRDAQGEWTKEKEGRYSRFLDPESARVMRRLVQRCRRVLVLNPEEESRWSSGDSAAEHYAAAGAAVIHVRSPLHLAEQLARVSMRGHGRSPNI